MEDNYFFMVYVEGQQAPAYKHTSLESAQKEAKRLAELLLKRAYILATVQSFELDKFKVEDCRPYGMLDELPF